MTRMCKSGTGRMKMGYEWGVYKSVIDERNESGIDVEVSKSGIDGMKAGYR